MNMIPIPNGTKVKVKMLKLNQYDGLTFTSSMKEYCGKETIILSSNYVASRNEYQYILDGCGDWVFNRFMFDIVKGEVAISKDDLLPRNEWKFGMSLSDIEKTTKEERVIGLDVSMGKYESLGRELGALVDKKQEAYGDSITKGGQLLEVFMQDYRQSDGSYIIPAELLKHIPMMVRIIDKQNRIFSNPAHDLMDESPYRDICGYGLLGNEMMKK